LLKFIFLSEISNPLLVDLPKAQVLQQRPGYKSEGVKVMTPWLLILHLVSLTYLNIILCNFLELIGDTGEFEERGLIPQIDRPM
jgi:hypothetical protein